MKRLFFLILLASLLVSCSTSKRYSPAYQNVMYFEGDFAGDPIGLAVGDSYTSNDKNVDLENAAQPRIVIYNASLNLVVKTPDSTNVLLTEIAKKYEGYVQTLGSKKSVIRVKADNLHEALADISGLGKVKSKTVSGEDVTDQYTDYKIRLENAYNARKRYLELLEKAENVEAALKVEKELERLNGEIDSMEGRLKMLEHLASYSTITIYMEEKVKPGILGYIGIGIYKSIKWLIVRN